VLPKGGPCSLGALKKSERNIKNKNGYGNGNGDGKKEMPAGILCVSALLANKFTPVV